MTEPSNGITGLWLRGGVVGDHTGSFYYMMLEQDGRSITGMRAISKPLRITWSFAVRLLAVSSRASVLS